MIVTLTESKRESKSEHTNQKKKTLPNANTKARAAGRRRKNAVKITHYAHTHRSSTVHTYIL